MTLFVCFVKSIGRVYTSTLTSFSEIFLAVNQRELSPAPAIPGGGGFINPYINDAGAAGANRAEGACGAVLIVRMVRTAPVPLHL